MGNKKKRGKYYTEVEPRLAEIEGWARQGLIDKQIAKNLGVGYSTFRNYKDIHQALQASLKKGKEVIDIEVENALLKRALGYEYEEIQTTTEDDAVLGKKEKVVKTKKHIAADTTAIAIWLNNRQPGKWKRNRGKEELDRLRFEHEKEIDSKKYW